jgi:hypothetical protein
LTVGQGNDDADEVLTAARRLAALVNERDELERQYAAKRADLDRQMREVIAEIRGSSAAKVKSSAPAPVIATDLPSPPEWMKGDLTAKRRKPRFVIPIPPEAAPLQARIMAVLARVHPESATTDYVVTTLGGDAQSIVWALQALQHKRGIVTKPERGKWGIDMDAYRKEQAKREATG